MEELTVYELPELDQEVEKKMEKINKRTNDNIKMFVKAFLNN